MSWSKKDQCVTSRRHAPGLQTRPTSGKVPESCAYQAKNSQSSGGRKRANLVVCSVPYGGRDALLLRQHYQLFLWCLWWCLCCDVFVAPAFLVAGDAKPAITPLNNNAQIILRIGSDLRFVRTTLLPWMQRLLTGCRFYRAGCLNHIKATICPCGSLPFADDPDGMA